MPKRGAFLLAHCRARIEANMSVSGYQEDRRHAERTFQELLASILLEESLVNHRASKVVNHEVNDWLDFLLGVTGIVR